MLTLLQWCSKRFVPFVMNEPFDPVAVLSPDYCKEEKIMRINFLRVFCTNPVTWKTDSVYAPAKQNKGCKSASFAETLIEVFLFYF